MADSTFSPEILSLIDERDRLEGLNAVSEVAIERDPLTEEWVFSISPRELSPRFESFKRFNVPGNQINSAIREAWASVARAAQVENQQAIEHAILQLEPTIPTEQGDEPKLSSWLPTETHGRWESTQSYGIWDIAPTAITQTKRFAYLQQAKDGFTLLLPDNRQVTVGQSKQPAKPYRIPENRAEMLRMKEEAKLAKAQGDPSIYNELMSPEERIHNQLRDHFIRIAQGEELEALVEQYEDRTLPKIIGLVIGVTIGVGLTALFLSKDDPETGGIFVLVCTAIWLLKRAIMFISSRA